MAEDTTQDDIGDCPRYDLDPSASPAIASMLSAFPDSSTACMNTIYRADSVGATSEEYCGCLNGLSTTAKQVSMMDFDPAIQRIIDQIIEKKITENLRSQLFNRMTEASFMDTSGLYSEAVLLKLKSCYRDKFLSGYQKSSRSNDLGCNAVPGARRFRSFLGVSSIEDARAEIDRIFEPVITNNFPAGANPQSSCLRAGSYASLTNHPINRDTYMNSLSTYSRAPWPGAFETLSSYQGMANLPDDVQGRFDDQVDGIGRTSPMGAVKETHASLANSLNADPLLLRILSDRRGSRKFARYVRNSRECQGQPDCPRPRDFFSDPENHELALENVRQTCELLNSDPVKNFFCGGNIPRLSHNFIVAQVLPEIYARFGEGADLVASSLLARNSCQLSSDNQFADKGPIEDQSTKDFNNALGNGYRQVSDLETMANRPVPEEGHEALEPEEQTKYERFNEIVCRNIPECMGTNPEAQCADPLFLKRRACENFRDSIVGPDDNESFNTLKARIMEEYFKTPDNGNMISNAFLNFEQDVGGEGQPNIRLTENNGLPIVDLRSGDSTEYQIRREQTILAYLHYQRYLNTLPGKVNAQCEVENETNYQSPIPIASLIPPFAPPAPPSEAENPHPQLVSLFSPYAEGDERGSIARDYVMNGSLDSETQLAQYEQTYGSGGSVVRNLTEPVSTYAPAPPVPDNPIPYTPRGFDSYQPSGRVADGGLRGTLANPPVEPPTIAPTTAPNPTTKAVTAKAATTDDNGATPEGNNDSSEGASSDGATSKANPRINGSNPSAAPTNAAGVSAPPGTSEPSAPASAPRSASVSPLPEDPASDDIDQRIQRLNEQINEYEAALANGNERGNRGMSAARRHQLRSEVAGLRGQKEQLQNRLGASRAAPIPPMPPNSLQPANRVASVDQGLEQGETAESIQDVQTEALQRSPASRTKSMSSEEQSQAKNMTDSALGALNSPGDGEVDARAQVAADLAELLQNKAKEKGFLKEPPSRELMPAFWYQKFIPEEHIANFGIERVLIAYDVVGKTIETYEEAIIPGQMVIKIREYALQSNALLDYEDLYTPRRSAHLLHIVDTVIPKLKEWGATKELVKIGSKYRMVKEKMYLYEFYEKHLEKYRYAEIEVVEKKMSELDINTFLGEIAAEEHLEASNHTNK